MTTDDKVSNDGRQEVDAEGLRHGGDLRSMLQTNFKEAAALGGNPRSRINPDGVPTNEHWAKGSLGMISGSMAGLTSDGRNLTEGLEYSSSALDIGSHANV